MDALPFDPVRHSRGGRPAKPPEKRRGQFVGFWATPGELLQLESAIADSQAVSRGAYLRAVVFPDQHARRVVQPQKRTRNIAPVVAQLGRLGGLLHQYLKEARFGHFTPDTEAAARQTMNALGDYFRKIATDESDDSET